MKIIFQHDGIIPVKTYGGIERMLFWHMKELVKQGHEVVLIGHQDCEVQKFGIELIKKNSEQWWNQIPKNSDIIQMYYNFEPPVDTPTVCNIGGNGKSGESFPINTVFVSKKHAQNHDSNSYVYNALDLEEYPFQPKEQSSWENFLFLAKASWSVKNLKHSIQSCKKAKKYLHIVGGKSFLPSRAINSLGMLGGEEKLAAIRRCDALLFPVRWEEPFGLAIVEAMTQGLPVIGSPYGSLPELITENHGIIVRSKEELIEQLLQPKKAFDANEIRRYVEDNFSIEVFTKKYIDIYKKVLSGETLNSKSPTWSRQSEAQHLLPF